MKQILSQLAQLEGELMGYHEGIDMLGEKVNWRNLSKGLLANSKKLNSIQKALMTSEKYKK